jgi:hypothetical protein
LDRERESWTEYEKKRRVELQMEWEGELDRIWNICCGLLALYSAG